MGGTHKSYSDVLSIKKYANCLYCSAYHSIVDKKKIKKTTNSFECFCTLPIIESGYSFLLGKMLFYYWIEMSSFIDFFLIFMLLNCIFELRQTTAWTKFYEQNLL